VTARVKVMKIENATDYPAFSYLVELEGEGRGLYAAASAVEANDIAKRINDFPAMVDRLADADITIVRLIKQLQKLRKAQRKGGAA